jgi:flagellar hook protein FlgE
MGAINTALTGLASSALQIDVYGNNIANAETAGFKSSAVQFRDVYTAAAGGAGTRDVGSGVTTGIIQNFSNGIVRAVDNPLALALDGNGFFITQLNGNTTYSRDGNFDLNKQNQIVNTLSGAQLMGLQANGTYGPLSIPTQNIPSIATSALKVGLNLDSGSTTPANAWVGAAGSPGGVPDPSTYNNSTSINVYDSLGNAHVYSMYFAKDAVTANTFNIYATVDGTDVAGSSTITFNSDGSYNSTNPDPVAVSHALTNGASDLAFTVDLSSATDFASPFSVNSITNDGSTTGSLTGLDVDTFGTITGRYSNGVSETIGTVQIATFANNQALQPVGSNMYVNTSASGPALISNGATGAAGSIQSGAIESSNTDLTANLVGLNVAQRNYSANAKTIQIASSLLDTLINKL